MNELLELFQATEAAPSNGATFPLSPVFTGREARIMARVLTSAEVAIAADIAAARSLCRSASAISAASARVLRIAASL